MRAGHRSTPSCSWATAAPGRRRSSTAFRRSSPKPLGQVGSFPRATCVTRAEAHAVAWCSTISSLASRTKSPFRRVAPAAVEELGCHRVHQRLEVVGMAGGRTSQRVPDVGQLAVFEALKADVSHATLLYSHLTMRKALPARSFVTLGFPWPGIAVRALLRKPRAG